MLTTMKKRIGFFALLFLLLQGGAVFAQTPGECFKFFLEQGEDASNNGNYFDAYGSYKSAAECLDNTPAQQAQADSLVRRATFQLDSALAAAKVLAKVNEIVGQALNWTELNPTLSVRLAHEACNISHNSNKLAVDVRRELLEKKDIAFYSLNVDCGCRVVAVAVSPDNRYVAFGCYDDGEVKLYDRVLGELTDVGSHDGESKNNPGSSGLTYRVCFSPDSKRLLSGSTDGTAKLWKLDGEEIKLLKTFEHDEDVGGIAFSPSGDSILTAAGKKVFLWSAQRNQRYKALYQYEMPDEVRGLAFSPDGLSAVCGMKNFSARIWQIADERNFKEFTGHAQAVSQVRFSRDGSLLLTGSSDHTAKLWDVRSGSELRTFEGHSAQLLSVDFSSDAQKIMTAGMDYQVKIWDRNGALLQTLPCTKTFFGAAALTPDDEYVVAGDLGKHIRFWPINTETYGDNLPHRDNISGLAVAPGDSLLLTGSTDHTAKIWRVGSTRVIWTFHADDEVVAADWARNGSFFILGLWNGTVHIFDRNRVMVGTFKGQHASSVMAVAMSPDGGRYITGGRDGKAKCWKITGANSVQQFNTIKHTKEVSTVDWSPQGDKIATGSWDGTAKVGPVSDAKAMITLTMPGAVHCVRFSPDGRYLLVCGAEGTARVYNAANGTLYQTLDHRGQVTVTAGEFSSSGDTIVTGSAGGWIRVWIRNGKNDKWIDADKAHTGSISAIRQLGHTNMFITAGSEGRARLYDYDGLASIRIYRGHIDDINFGVLTPDKKTFITTSLDRSIKHWYLNNRTWSTLHARGPITAIAPLPPDGDELLIGAIVEKQGLLSRFNTEKKDTSFTVSKFEGNITSIATFNAPRAGSRYAACDDKGTVRVFETRTHKLLKEHVFPAPTYALKFAPRTGKFIVVGTGKATEDDVFTYVYLWDWEKDTIVQELPHLWDIHAVAISADEETFVSGDDRGFIKFWRKEDGALLKVCDNNRDTTTSLTFSPNGNYLLSTCKGGDVQIWDASQRAKAEYCLLELSLEDDAVVSADFISNDSIILFGKRLGPAIMPNRLQQLDRDDSPISPITSAQREEFNIEFELEGCKSSNNPQEVGECAHYFIKRFQDADDVTALTKADSLFDKLIELSATDETLLSDYYDSYGTRVEGLANIQQYDKAVYYSGRRVKAVQQLYIIDSTSTTYGNNLFSAYWNYSWYLLLTGQFDAALGAANAGLAVPSDSETQIGILSNKLLAELMVANTDADFDRVKKLYEKHLSDPWVDERFKTFGEVFEDDFKELLKNRPDLPPFQKNKIERIRKEVLKLR